MNNNNTLGYLQASKASTTGAGTQWNSYHIAIIKGMKLSSNTEWRRVMTKNRGQVSQIFFILLTVGSIVLSRLNLRSFLVNHYHFKTFTCIYKLKWHSCFWAVLAYLLAQKQNLWWDTHIRTHNISHLFLTFKSIPTEFISERFSWIGCFFSNIQPVQM